MSDYKIVASDLDGTLLDEKSEVSKENIAAIHKFAKKGVWFVPSTGRTMAEIPEKIKNNPDIRYFIHSNGAVVFDKKTGDRILNCVEQSIGKKVLDIVSDYQVHMTLRKDGDCHVDAGCQTEEIWDYYNVCREHQVVVRDYAKLHEDFKERIYSSDDVEVFSFFFHSMEEKLECKERLLQIKEVKVAAAAEYNLEIFNANAGKGQALYMLADLLGVDYSQTISMGDSNNDSSITQAAGLGLAVSNACQSLKDVADEIICSNEEHAAEYVFNRYFSK